MAYSEPKTWVFGFWRAFNPLITTRTRTSSNLPCGVMPSETGVVWRAVSGAENGFEIAGPKRKNGFKWGTWESRRDFGDTTRW